MGRAGKSYVSECSSTGTSRPRRKSSTATPSSSRPEESHAQLKAKVDSQAVVITKQKSKLARLGTTIKAFACIIPKLMSATGIEGDANLQEVLHEAATEAEDEDDEEEVEEEAEEEEHVPVDLSAGYSHIGHTHSRGSGGIVMMPTPGLQPRSSYPQPSIGKGKGKGIAHDEEDEEIDTD